MSAAAFLLALGAFAALAMAMPKHFRTVMARELTPGTSRLLTIIGWSLLAASLFPSLAGWGPLVGIVAWLGLLNLAAVIAALGLTVVNRARRT